MAGQCGRERLGQSMHSASRDARTAPVAACAPATDGTAPRIAVVIPVRNRRDVVLRAVESVLRQKFEAWELVVVDDGSDDGTAEVVSAIADPRIRVVKQDRRGGGNAARNRGVRETHAPLIAFLDSDDEFLPHKLGVVVARFDAEPDLGTLLDSYAIVNPDRHGGRPEPLINPAIATSEAFIAALFDSSVRSRRIRKSASGMSMRREVALRAGLFDERIARAQDMEFLARLAKTARCATTPAQLWIKHELPGRISFNGDGFVAATLHMLRTHPEYAAGRTRFPADVVAYFWLTMRRGQARQISADLALLQGELGTAALVRTLIHGVRARLIDAKLAAWVSRRSASG